MNVCLEVLKIMESEISQECKCDAVRELSTKVPSMLLCETNVTELFLYCMPDEDEVVRNVSVHASSICKDVVVMNAHRIAEQKSRILALMLQLNDLFLSKRIYPYTGGGGHTFTDGRESFDGKQWTDSNKVVEQLFILGLASGYLDKQPSYNPDAQCWKDIQYFTVKMEANSVQQYFIEDFMQRYECVDVR